MLRLRLYAIIKSPSNCLNKSQWLIVAHWKKEKTLQINIFMGYLSPQKNFENTEVFTRKNNFEIEIVLSTRLL